MNGNSEVHVHAIGSFGASVADVLRLYISTLTATYRAEMKDVLGKPFPAAGIQVLAVAAPAEADCATFTRLCYANSSAFVPLALQPGRLWLGPVTGPQLGSCWVCAMRRCRQHLRPNLSHDLDKPESSDGASIPGRLLPLVTSGIWHLLHVMQLGRLPHSLAWCMDLKTYEITRQKVVTIHACEFCGFAQRGSDAQGRQMRDALSYLWPQSEKSV